MNRKSLTTLCLFAALISPPALAGNVTWEIRGLVTSIDAGLLTGISVNDPFRLSVKLTDEATKNGYAPGYSLGDVTTKYAIHDLTVTVGDFTGKHHFPSDWPSNIMTLPGVFVRDGLPSSPGDALSVSTNIYKMAAPPQGDRHLVGVFARFEDPTEAVFDDNSFPDAFPDLSNFDEMEFGLGFSNDYKSGFAAYDYKMVRGQVLEVTSVPIPSALILFGSSLLALFSITPRRSGESHQAIGYR